MDEDAVQDVLDFDPLREKQSVLKNGVDRFILSFVGHGTPVQQVDG